MIFDFERDCDEILSLIKNSPWFPFRTGFLRDQATNGNLVKSDTYIIKFDSTIANYIQFLEEGTEAHDIPGAFGYDLPFGIGGRFDGKFHPGSTKHQGFIKNKSINTILNYFVNKYTAGVEIK